MNTFATAIVAAAVLSAGGFGIASAQQYGYPNQSGYPGQYRHHRQNRNGEGQQCNAGNYGGSYNQGYTAGACTTLRGTIAAVNGSQVTLRVERNQNRNANGNGNYSGGRYGNAGYDYRRGGQEITIDDQPALDNRTTGRVSVGRYVNVVGYWRNGVFYATAMN